MSTLSTMRRSLSIPRALLMLGGALALLPATVRAQDLEVPGVPVQITGQGYGRSQYGESAELYFEGSGFLAKSPADGSGTVLDLMSETWSTTFVWFNTPKATLQMEPGKTYYVSAWGARITKLWLHIHAPTGYQVEIDGLVRPHLQITGTSHIYTIRLSSPADDLVARAGTASSIAGDRLWWQTALGSLRNGESARSLAIIDSGTSSSWSSIFTPAGLQYQEPSEEIYVHRVSNNIRQIIANEAAVDVVTLSGTSYELRFYNPSQVIGSSGLRTFTGSPFVTYKIEQGGTTTTLKITSTTRNLSTGTTARTAETTCANYQIMDT